MNVIEMSSISDMYATLENGDIIIYHSDHVTFYSTIFHLITLLDTW